QARAVVGGPYRPEAPGRLLLLWSRRGWPGISLGGTFHNVPVVIEIDLRRTAVAIDVLTLTVPSERDQAVADAVQLAGDRHLGVCPQERSNVADVERNPVG